MAVRGSPEVLGWLLPLLVAAMVGDLPKQGQHTGVDLVTDPDSNMAGQSPVDSIHTYVYIYVYVDVYVCVRLELYKYIRLYRTIYVYIEICFV